VNNNFKLLSKRVITSEEKRGLNLGEKENRAYLRNIYYRHHLSSLLFINPTSVHTSPYHKYIRGTAINMDKKKLFSLLHVVVRCHGVIEILND
jgi:hypothetical protein